MHWLSLALMICGLSKAIIAILAQFGPFASKGAVEHARDECRKARPGRMQAVLGGVLGSIKVLVDNYQEDYRVSYGWKRKVVSVMTTVVVGALRHAAPIRADTKQHGSAEMQEQGNRAKLASELKKHWEAAGAWTDAVGGSKETNEFFERVKHEHEEAGYHGEHTWNDDQSHALNAAPVMPNSDAAVLLVVLTVLLLLRSATYAAQNRFFYMCGDDGMTRRLYRIRCYVWRGLRGYKEKESQQVAASPQAAAAGSGLRRSCARFGPGTR